MIRNPYEVLGIREGASMEEIKRAYRQKAKAYHPDLHSDDPKANEKMQQINEAYDMLSNPDKYRNRQSAWDGFDRQGHADYTGYNADPDGQYRRYTYYYTTGNPWSKGQSDAPERQSAGIVNPFRGIFRVIGGIMLFRFIITLLRIALFGFFF